MRKREMQYKKNRTIAILFIAILAISTSASMIMLQSTSAHTPPWQIQLFAFVNVGPNPAGIGQTVTIGFWLNAPPMTAGTIYGDRFGPFTVHVVKPDGTNDTLGPFTSDDTGGTSTRYTPDQLGTYKFQMTYPGQTLNGGQYGLTGISNPNYINDTILPAISDVATLTVQQESVPSIANPALPTNYWQTPINALNVNNWYAIGGPYLGLYIGYSAGKGGSNYNTTTNFNPYSTAPLTSHIIWTRPVAFGGVIGGDAGGTTTYGNYYSTAQYERKYNPIVINGYLYYTQIPGSSANPTANVCVDLYTGQTVWVDDSNNLGGGNPAQTALTATGQVTPLVSGQVLDYVSPNQYGGIAYLWTSGAPGGIYTRPGTTCLNMFDAMTGKYILSIVNGTGFSYGHTVDASGDFIDYYANTTVGTQTIYGQIQPVIGPAPTKVTNTAGNSLLEVWNSTQCIMLGAGWSATSGSGWNWKPNQNLVIDYSLGIQSAWQLPGTIPFGAYANNATLPNTWVIMGVNSGVAVLYSAANQGLTNYFQTGYTIFTGYDINTGNQLFVKNITFTPFTAVNLDNYGNVGDGVFTTVIKETGEVTAFSVTTGNQVWKTTLKGDNGADINAYDTIGGIKGNIYGDNFYLFGFGGDIWSIKLSDGSLNWYTNTTKYTGDAGYNTPYNIWPIWVQTGIGGGGGIMFLGEGHEYSPPLFIGAQQLAINCTTGDLVWTIDSFNVNSNPELAYGIMTNLNAYDNQIYAFGRGPSATTVSAPQVGVTTATPITITGTVTDVSAGAKQEAVAANYHYGLPAVSDTSMTSFMESVYMQQPIPHNITGVPVTLSVVDSNGNYRTIGTTTSDGTGTYGFTWTPDISGAYTVIATFTGTNAYYGSTAQTHISATEAATPAPTSQTSTGNYTTTTDFAIGIAAIIVVLVIIGAAIMMMLRKRA
jgi:hypothetical protein